jgi:non-specific serine/threonine protein kinase/serine/threonine-protein kinase
MPKDEDQPDIDHVDTVSKAVDASRFRSESLLRPGDSLGSYKILEQIGEGGFAIVYLAEQKEPVRRRVALKIVKLGMDTKQVVARFEAERQALALMDHSAIAKVYDAGSTPQGRPYFAMEYVKGVPITTHCDRHRLSNTERLELFMQVCEGVQHAHQKAIIHRDLKPSNVLVSIQDGKPVPKIIDFGVAKATAQRLTEKTVFTELGVLIGTPEYMSPEQAEMTEQDVDTRTDVYALGVMLYELLVGALPFDSKELRSLGYEGIRRKIREEEPPRPSTRLSTLGEHSTESAKRRRTELPALQRELSGDLDWITMKALEKDRTRRYGSPAELAADVERHLKNEPVVAGPPSRVYRAKKFVRRNRFGVAVATVAVVALIGFALAMGILARRIDLERQQVEKAKDDLEKVVEFQASMLSDLDVEQVGRRLVEDQRRRVAEAFRERGESETQVEARLASLDESLGSVNATDVARRLIDEEILGRAGTTIDEQFAEQPLVAATLRQEIASTYHELGLRERALPYQEMALATRSELLGDDHPDTLASKTSLAILYWNQGRIAEAEPLFLKAFETSKRVFDPDDRRTLAAMGNVAMVYKNQGRYDEAEPLYLETLEMRKRVHGAEHPRTLWAMSDLALVYMRQGRDTEAESLFLETLETRKRVQGADHTDTLASMHNLAILYRDQGRYAEAEALVLKMLETRKRVQGTEHPSTFGATNLLGILYRDQGRYAKAEALNLKTLETSKRVFGPDHGTTLWTMYALAGLEAQRGERSKGIGWLQQAVEAGFTDADHMAEDEDLEPLHGPEFDALVERARQNAAAQRAQ